MSQLLRRRGRRIWPWLLILILLLGAAGFALSWRAEIAPAAAPPAASFPPALVQRGAQLSAIGSCMTCHTSANSAPFAGGFPLQTPFGIIYSTNITPDAETGIGRWPEAAFRRALREGIARDGHHLYPAFPYVHFTRLADDDIHALYGFIMTRDPVNAPARGNDLPFPLNLRQLVAGWNLLFLDKNPRPPEPARTAEWNRGAYLVDSLGHCSACHSPRNKLGAENKRQYLDGGEAEGWYVPALNANSPSPLPWTAEALATYLRTGIATDHAVAGGPMQGVVESLRDADEKDVQAIAAYVVSIMGAPTAERQARSTGARQRASAPLAMPAVASAAPANTASTATTAANASASADTTTAAVTAAQSNDRQLLAGAAVYANACARCHDGGRLVSSEGGLQLPLAVAVYDPDPRSLIRIIRQGIAPPEGEPGRFMPAFATLLTDEQLVALATYLRRTAADAPAWSDLPAAVQKAKSP